MKEELLRKAGKQEGISSSEIPNLNYFLGSCVPQKSLNNQPTIINKSYGS